MRNRLIIGLLTAYMITMLHIGNARTSDAAYYIGDQFGHILLLLIISILVSGFSRIFSILLLILSVWKLPDMFADYRRTHFQWLDFLGILLVFFWLLIAMLKRGHGTMD